MIPDISLEANKEQRTPCVLIVDGSDSMNTSGAINELNNALKTFEASLKADESAVTRVRVMVIRMAGNDPAVLHDWTDAIDFEAPEVDAHGLTPMGKAVDLAMHKIEDEKVRMRTTGISHTRPWIFLLSDGHPNDDDWQLVAERSRKAQEERRFVLFPVGVGDHASKESLEMFALDRPMVRVDAARFEEMFEWLSNSLSTVSQAASGQDQVSLPPLNWGTVDA